MEMRATFFSYGLLSFILILSDYCLIESLINSGVGSFSKGFKGHFPLEDPCKYSTIRRGRGGKRGRSLETLSYQKRPVGGDFIELGSSLITLLNLAQEIGSSNNLRFRQAADKLRDQFARSFALRYDLEKSQFLSAALSSIDGDSQLTPVQLALQDIVLSQLKGIEKKASSIIFFNEPMTNFEDINYSFKFPYSALDLYVLGEEALRYVRCPYMCDCSLKVLFFYCSYHCCVFIVMARNIFLPRLLHSRKGGWQLLTFFVLCSYAFKILYCIFVFLSFSNV